jgi:hypothetical protein
MCCGDARRIVIDVRKRAVDEWLLQGDYSSDREYRSAFHRWLADIWAEKDERIKAMRDGLRPDRVASTER